MEEDEEDDSEGPQPTPYNPLIFWPAALCDMTATSIQYIALTLTYASSFQMLRGKTKHFFIRVFDILKAIFDDRELRGGLSMSFIIFVLLACGTL